MFLRGSTSAILGVALLHATMAGAVSPADKCAAAKLKVAGKYSFCRLKTDAKAIRTGARTEYTTCDSAFAAKWVRAETKGGGMCPSNGDAAPVQALIIEHTDNVFALLTDPCTGADGTCSASRTIWTVVADRNAASFGGHTDWRVPTLAELISIVD